MIIPLIVLLFSTITSAMQPLPTLVDLCLAALNTIPPEQFSLFKRLSPDVQQKYITRYGPTYTPKLFNLTTNNGTYALDGPVTDKPLTLKNYFAIITICKNQPSEPEVSDFPSIPYIADPDFCYAYLHNETIYIGTEHGFLHHYRINKQQPLFVDRQQLDGSAITYITVHPQQKDFMCAKDNNGRIQLYKKNNGIWQTLMTLANRNIKHISFSPLEPLLACAEQYKIWLYTITDPPTQLPQTMLLPTDNIQGVLFDQNGNLLVQSIKNPCKTQPLFVWNIGSDQIPCYTIWPNTAKININQSMTYGTDTDFDTHEWLTKTASQILFLATLERVTTQHALNRFKKHCDALHCGQTPLLNYWHSIVKATN